MFEGIAPKRVDIVAFVNQCVARLDSDLRTRGIAFESTVRHEGPVEVLADQRALQHIVLGLVANAAEAVAQRQDAMIALDFVASDREVRMSISDNGVGIEDDHIDKVFLPLFTTKPKGTGLGLAIGRNLITKMDGTIDLWSAIGEGTKVEISLPRLLPAAVGEEATGPDG
jgi:signal transduction histidine kinase